MDKKSFILVSPLLSEILQKRSFIIDTHCWMQHLTKDILTTKRTKYSEIITFQFPYFVLFATFVVKCLFRFWCSVAALVPSW